MGRLTMVSVRAEPHKEYVTERMWSSEAYCQRWAPGAWKIWSSKGPVPPKGTPQVLYLNLLAMGEKTLNYEATI